MQSNPKSAQPENEAKLLICKLYKMLTELNNRSAWQLLEQLSETVVIQWKDHILPKTLNQLLFLHLHRHQTLNRSKTYLKLSWSLLKIYSNIMLIYNYHTFTVLSYFIKLALFFSDWPRRENLGHFNSEVHWHNINRLPTGLPKMSHCRCC